VLHYIWGRPRASSKLQGAGSNEQTTLLNKTNSTGAELAGGDRTRLNNAKSVRKETWIWKYKELESTDVEGEFCTSPRFWLWIFGQGQTSKAKATVSRPGTNIITAKYFTCCHYQVTVGYGYTSSSYQKPVAHGEIKLATVVASFQPTVDSFVLFQFQGCADAWNKAGYRQHCLTAVLFQTSAHPWNLNSFAVLKNMLMRLKQFQCFISVLFHHVRRAKYLIYEAALETTLCPDKKLDPEGNCYNAAKISQLCPIFYTYGQQRKGNFDRDVQDITNCMSV